jgi:hypothetical protein
LVDLHFPATVWLSAHPDDLFCQGGRSLYFDRGKIGVGRNHEELRWIASPEMQDRDGTGRIEQVFCRED